MKLLRYGPAGAEKTGMLDADGTVRDLSGHVPVLAGAARRVHAFLRQRLWRGSELWRAMAVDAAGQAAPLGRASPGTSPGRHPNRGAPRAPPA